jgi:hypothetical protein
MTGQCSTCGTPLPEGSRSPYCLPHYLEHQKERNRAKVRAHRARERAARPRPPIQLPSDQSRDWLRASDLGIAEPIDSVSELLAAGRVGSDPEIGEAVRDGLGRYDQLRDQFEAWVAQTRGHEPEADEWRAFFEAVRGSLQ